MYEVMISESNGVIHKINISADDISGVYNAVSNMYGNGNYQIISVIKK